MSESSTLTRCPHCETRFRVTEAQLGIARGKVRCGHCLQVFNASEHRESPAEAKPSRAAADPLADEEFIFEDDPEEDAAEGNYAGRKTAFSDDELSDSFLAFDSNTDNRFNENTEEPDESVDESWAEAILANNNPDHPPSSAAKTAVTAPETHRDQPEAAEPPRESAQLDDSGPSAPTERPAEDDTFFIDNASREAHSSASDSSTGEAPVTTEGPGVAAGRDNDPGTAAERTPYHNLRADAITTRNASSSGGNGGLGRIIWGVGLVALLGFLVAQVTYFQVERLSSIPELRPYYETGCELIGCELPTLVAVDRIDSQKLVVRTHPEQRNMLVVDAVMVNRAEFVQPFPNIGLTFSNLNEDVVAQSLFEPDEYLAGDAKNLEAMPSDTPIRISIGIRDPGRDAVNYNISFIARK
jgi:predicted Zn finger-like uncharacterized protein